MRGQFILCWRWYLPLLFLFKWIHRRWLQLHRYCYAEFYNSHRGIVIKHGKILCCNFLFTLFGLFGVHKTRNRIAILYLIHTMPILYYNFINLNTVENTPIPYQTYEANIHLWLQTLMNVRALKQTSVTPVPFVQTQQDPTFVGAWKDIRVMAETVLVNNTSSWSLLSTSGSLFCYTVLGETFLQAV